MVMSARNRLLIEGLERFSKLKSKRHLIPQSALPRFAAIGERLMSGKPPRGSDMAYLRGLEMVAIGGVPAGSVTQETINRQRAWYWEERKRVREASGR